MGNELPAGWKTYDEFAAGIATNRLPPSHALNGWSDVVHFKDGRTLSLQIADRRASWSDDAGSGHDPCEIVEVAPDTFFIELLFGERNNQAETLVVNRRTRRVLSIYSIVRPKEEAVGEPQVAQIFRPGILGDPSSPATGMEPAETRDLVGMRAHFTYSPNHVYEHTYLSSQRYCWQCLVGVQRGHGDVDMTTTYKFDENQYVFTFREFKIAVASTFFYNFDDMRSTGKFLGITGDGRIENNPAGALIRKVSMTYYLPGQEPV
jgi:hypothetical protein